MQFGRPIAMFQAVKHHCANMLVAAELATAAHAGPPVAAHRLAFSTEIQNLRFSEVPLQPKLSHPAAVACETALGAVGFGHIPHRERGESFESTDHFIAFAAVYPGDGPPLLLVDLDGDGQLTCRERLDPVAHPRDPNRWFRSVKVEWRDKGPFRSASNATAPSSLRGFVRRQIRARLPALGQARFRAYPRQARADYEPTVPAAPPLGFRAHALQPTNRRDAVRRLCRFGAKPEPRPAPRSQRFRRS